MMHRLLMAFTILTLTLTVGCASRGPSSADLILQAQIYTWPDPARFDAAIQKFEEEEPQPTGAVVAVGSSSMRLWHADIGEDLAPLTIIPRGFGGSNMYDALHHMDRAVLAHQPRAVLLYEGDNDMAMDLPPEAFLDAFRAFTKRVHEADRRTRIYVVSIKPSPSRMKFWDKMQTANALVRAECEKDSRLFYIDIATPMMGEDGQPREELFRADRLHLNRAGYEVWRDAVAPVIVPLETRRERRVRPTAIAQAAP